MTDNGALAALIAQCHPFEPTQEQADAINLLAGFLASAAERSVFVLRGYAGTGKTTLTGAVTRAMRRMRRKTVLLAPTGRAAKVFSLYSGFPAYTIHKRIYRQKSALDGDTFSLDINKDEETLFLVDEASMISNDGLATGTLFGSGRLLDDLVRYVFSGRGNRLLLIGDDAQLPPVGEAESPALSPAFLKGYGLTVMEFTLRNVLRQSVESGILANATRLRRSIPLPGTVPDITGFRFQLKGFTDIENISGSDLIEKLGECYSSDGLEETMVLCRSNRRANIYNNGIRAKILDREDELNRGDMLMVVRNNYYWTGKVSEEDERAGTVTENMPPFIANGDIAEVIRIRRGREMYGFHYENILLSFPDYDGYEMECTVMLDTLHSESPSLTAEENRRLYEAVRADYEDERLTKKELIEKIRQNPYFNALQVKYAYAVTCHKAQGGQWRNIFIDQGYVPEDQRGSDYYRWLYTALTRSTERVYLVNWPEEQMD